MTITSGPRPAVASPHARTVLLGLAGFVLVAFTAMLLTGSDLEADAPLKDIVASHDESRAFMQWTSYLGMVLCAAVIALGAGVRRAVGRSWASDVALAGFVVVALTTASWGVLDYAVWDVVQVGDDSATRALHALSATSFLPLMCGMLCAYVGTGLAGLSSGSLPKWLAVLSICVGVLAPLGPLGFVPAMLLPLWFMAVAATVRQR